MRKLLLFSFFVLINAVSFGQGKRSLLISFITRYDRHADYVSNFGGRSYNDTNKLYGLNYGLNIIFRQRIAKIYSIIAGIGYYQLKIDEIKGNQHFNIPGLRTTRNIIYSDSTLLLYSTSKYHYNNIMINFGVDREFFIKNDLKFDLMTEVIGYKTISQKYSLLDGSRFYTTHNNKPMEFGINIQAGLIKEFSKFYLWPSLLIPVYQNLKGDKVFTEARYMNISKWFNGIGISLRIGKYLR